MFAAADGNGLFQRRRDLPRERAGRFQVARLAPDDLDIGRPAGEQLRLGGIELGLRRAQARACLGDIGARDFAHLEAVLHRAELLLEHRNVVAAQIDDGGIAHHVGECLGRLQQHVLFGIAQAFVCRAHRRLGLLGGIDRAIAVEQGLVDRDTDGAGRRRTGRPVPLVALVSLYSAPP